MPAKSLWLVQLPEIIEHLERIGTPVVDRSCIETLFRVARRRAIQLMHQFGGYQAGKTFLIDRLALIEHLRLAAEGGEFFHERRRRSRVGAALQSLASAAKARQVVVPVNSSVYDTTLASLPAGVSLDAGRLTVEFASPEELVGKLFAVAQALVNDYGKVEV
ncbi:MAG: hypothetical protein IT160_13480 [Bryobacterales bacterium]|nr:hypothetical protein [Bryobacterales bacterium]